MQFLISSVASGSVLATGLRQLLIKASIVTLYDVGGASLGLPGSPFGTMTNREKQRGVIALLDDWSCTNEVL